MLYLWQLGFQSNVIWFFPSLIIKKCLLISTWNSCHIRVNWIKAYYLEQWDTLKFSVIGHEYYTVSYTFLWTSALALFFFFPRDSAISYAIFRTFNSIMLFNSLLDCGAIKSYINSIFGYTLAKWLYLVINILGGMKKGVLPERYRALLR